MSDLTDERLSKLLRNGRSELEPGELTVMITELSSHRAAQAADEERVRSVVLDVVMGVLNTKRIPDGDDRDWGQFLIEEIATRAAKQLASAAVRRPGIANVIVDVAKHAIPPGSSEINRGMLESFAGLVACRVELELGKVTP